MEYSNPHQIGLIGFSGTPEDFPTRRAILKLDITDSMEFLYRAFLLSVKYNSHLYHTKYEN